MRLSHISLTARDADALAAFYRRVFGCTELRARRRLRGAVVWRGNGLPGTAIDSLWLGLPGAAGVFLEILEYSETQHGVAPAVNSPGYGHLSFVVEDLEATMAAILAAGGQTQGEITNFGSAAAPFLIVYVRDPEGNVIELEQPD
ncbi:VOC family protein [Pararhodobacter zhoushanensis]|uniref:VOC family protein n=1 Tax=Pararhodobacter zhoushanensis TaxID=2479545 RepID=A0ABT3H0J6_9RHOB|nr:VOC family protein [Pararhodobacter zhoushanensis]MCW1933238.1 VOC family protein [Pararhodobacter zhoushanensis]